MESVYSSPEKLKHLHILISLITINGDTTNKDRQLIYTLGLYHGLSFTEIDMLVYHPLNLFHFKNLNHSEKWNLLMDIINILPLKNEPKLIQEKESLCLLIAEKLGIHKNEALDALRKCNIKMEEMNSN